MSEMRYIGETDKLGRRFYGYRHPSATQQTSVRINAKLLQALGVQAKITAFAAMSDAWIEVAGQRRNVDLSSKTVRLLLESAAILECGEANTEILNQAD
jgi:predicted glycosyltransferase